MTWKVVNFAILAAGLGYLLAKNLPPFFHSRTSSIQKEIAEAQKVKQESERRAAEIDKRVSAWAPTSKRFACNPAPRWSAKASASARKPPPHPQAQHQAQIEIESAGKTARRELRAYAADLALDLAGQRIRARLDAARKRAWWTISWGI